MRAESLLKTFIALPVMGLWLLIGFKGCVITPYYTPNADIVYWDLSHIDESSTLFALLPGNKAMIWLLKPQEKYLEGIAVKIRGHHGERCIWNLWTLNNQASYWISLLGLRIYPSDVHPVVMEFEVINKFPKDLKNPVLPNVGETQTETVLLSNRVVTLRGITFEEEETPRPDQLAPLKGYLNL